MAASPYFDHTYFIPTYFDDDAATSAGGPPPKRRRPIQLPAEEPPFLQDEEFLEWIT